MQSRWLAVLLLALSCCSRDSGEPGGPLSPAPARDSVTVLSNAAETAAAVGAIFETGAARSLIALGPRMFFPSLTTPGIRSSCGVALTRAEAPAGPPVQIVPDSLWRRVYVLDGASGIYRWYGDTTGPPNGVRFLLAAVDSFDTPLVPPIAAGSLELLDQSTPGQSQVAAVLRSTRSQVMTYVVRPAAIAATRVSIVAGTARNWVFRDSLAEDGLNVNMNSEFTDLERGRRVHFAASRRIFDPADNGYQFDLAATHAGRTVQVSGRTDTYCFQSRSTATLAENGILFATFSRDDTGMALTSADSVPLTAEQVHAVMTLLDSQNRLFGGLYGLYFPLGLLLRI